MTAGPIDDFKSTVVSKKAHGDKESKDILIGSLIAGQYEILDSLGSGGMSTVYRANDLVLGRQVAVKLLKTGSVVSEKQLGRFQREARAVASLKHPRISPLFTAGLTEDNLPYIVMELIEGQPLSSIIKKTGRMETLRAIDVALEIADALA
ncbi:MAG: protein kinase, partial [Candidatus Obscuribacterales bacterium]|nr:protein kinase [Candidatus Obscuribacterales bacterium]